MFEPPRDVINQPFQALASHRDLVHSVAFDQHGKRLVTCSSDMSVAIWDRKRDGTWKRSAIWKSHGGAVWKAAWAHPEFGSIIATCSYDRNIYIWEEVKIKKRDALTRKERKDSNEHSQWIRRNNICDSRANVTDLSFAPRHLGLMIAACTAQGTIRIYEAVDVMDCGNWSLVHELQAFHTRCGCITWSHSRLHRPLIAVGSDEKKSESTERIVIYENVDGVRKWQRITSIKFDLPGPVTDLKFSPITMIDSHQLAIAAADVHIYCLKVSKAAVLDDDYEEGIGEIPVTSAEYSSNKVAHLGDLRKAWKVRYNVMGTVITATSCDGTVRSWKSLYMNQWVKLSEMSAEDYMTTTDDKPAIKGYLSERTKEQASKVYY